MFRGRLLVRLSFDPAVAEGRRLNLEQVLLTFARENGGYDQIRFIDVMGREMVRISRPRLRRMMREYAIEPPADADSDLTAD